MNKMNGNMLQAMADGMSVEWQRQRAETQMTLGKFIEKLETMPRSMKIDGLDHPHSYRGYYIDLAFERVDNKRTVKKTLKMLKECLGEEFEGYKGGDFWMTKGTPLWRAFYGDCGDRIMDIDVETGIIVVVSDNT